MKFLLKETIILFENKRLCDKISFSGDKMKKQYLIDSIKKEIVKK